MNHPHTVKKAQEELDIHVGKERQVEGSDTKNLVYLQAIISSRKQYVYFQPELLWHHASLLRTARWEDITRPKRHPFTCQCLENPSRSMCTHGWSNTNEFRPERFLTTRKDVDFKGQHFDYIPFGNGRRSCTGIYLALQKSCNWRWLLGCMGLNLKLSQVNWLIQVRLQDYLILISLHLKFYLLRFYPLACMDKMVVRLSDRTCLS